MSRLLFCLFFSSLSFSVLAQSTRFDLSKNPAGQPNPAAQSNAGMLRAASEKKPDSSLLNPKGMDDGTYTGRGMNNDQLLNKQSTQYKLGNTRATSTIYYDESGKVKGSSTTFGGK